MLELLNIRTIAIPRKNMPFIKSNLRIVGNQMEPFRFFFWGVIYYSKDMVTKIRTVFEPN